MNPYSYVLTIFPAAGNIENAALAAVVQLMGEAYSSGFVQGPGNNPFDYVSRQVNAKFGPAHPVASRLAVLFGQYLGK